MKIGFTGTRKGLIKKQREELTRWLGLPPGEFHHGGAIGADTTAAEIAKDLRHVIVEHPAGTNPLKRNKEIVDVCDVLIACPALRVEELRSGTWATIRYARTVGRTTIIIWP